MTPPIPDPKPGDAKAKRLVLPPAGPVRPKRRFNLHANAIDQAASTRAVAALEPERIRPAKFKRSGEPLQTWKAPPEHLSAGHQPKPGFWSFFLELMRSGKRVLAWLCAARLRHSH